LARITGVLRSRNGSAVLTEDGEGNVGNGNEISTDGGLSSKRTFFCAEKIKFLGRAH